MARRKGLYEVDGELGSVRKLSNLLLIELDMGLRRFVHTIYCGGDRYRTHSRAVFSGGALSRRTGPSSGRGGRGVRRGLWRDCGGRDGDRDCAEHDRAGAEGIGVGRALAAN